MAPRRALALLLSIVLALVLTGVADTAQARPGGRAAGGGHRASHPGKKPKKCGKTGKKGKRSRALVKPRKPKKKKCGGGGGTPETRTFTVRYQLQGHYHAVTSYTDDTHGFCPGTGSVEDADVNVLNVANLSVLVGVAGQLQFDPSLQSTDPVGSWSASATGIDEGDPCSTAKPDSCQGSVVTAAPGSSYIDVGTDASQIGFESDLAGVPTEQHDAASGCAEQREPSEEFSLYAALRPYTKTSVAVPWKQLAALGVGQQLALPTTFRDAPGPDYSPGTCNSTAPCTGSLSPLTSTITVIRTM